MPIFDVESGKYAKLPKTFVVENGKYVALKSAFVVENGKYVKLWNSGPEHFVAIGDRGDVAISEDGITWKVSRISVDGVVMSGPSLSATINTKMTISYANGVYVAAPYSQSGTTLWWSTDGVNYTSATYTAQSGVAGWKVCNGTVNGRSMFIAYPEGGGYPLYSYDGKTWTQSTSSVRYDPTTIRFINGRFVSVRNSNCYWSSNGTYWNPATDVTTSRSCLDMTYAFGKYVTAASTAYLYYTSDLNGTWTSLSLTHDSVYPATLATNGNIITALGRGTSGKSAGIYLSSSLSPGSTTGLSFFSSATSGGYTASTYHDKFVAAANGGQISYSNDGKAWTQIAYLQGTNGAITFTHVIHTANIGG